MSLMELLPPASREQLKVASNPAKLLAIEAGPGTGKTLTATERYGRLLFDPALRPNRGVTVLSFTVVATSVIERAISRRWGADALAWPSKTSTFDAVFRSILNFLLRTEALHWPKQAMEVSALDEWFDLNPAVQINPQEWLPILQGRQVTCAMRRTSPGKYVVTAKKRLVPQLEGALCSHESIRELVLSAADDVKLRSQIVKYLGTTASCVLVDEAFDSNESDIELLKLYLDAGCSVSVAGDPWQAIYGFREKIPDSAAERPVLLRSEFLTPLGFTECVLSECFRFDESLSSMMAQLRRGERVELNPVKHPDVVLAPEWEHLWTAGPKVIPLAFGQVRSKLDAVICLMLDVVLRNNGQTGARLAGTACSILGVEAGTVRQQAASAFAPVLELLLQGGTTEAKTALDRLSAIPKESFGAAKKLPVGDREHEKHLWKLLELGRRLRFGGGLVPGMTIHQAKGDEWDRVGLLLTDNDRATLRAGLRQDAPRHRLIYVALTRAKIEVGTFDAL